MAADQVRVSCVSLVLLLATSLATPAAFLDNKDLKIVREKRAALVLDRLLVALQRALHEPAAPPSPEESPLVAPLRTSHFDDQMMSLERRGQAMPSPARGRVLRCYFNAVTCF